MLPVYLMVLRWLFCRPRDYRTVAITAGYVIGLLVAIIVGLDALDFELTLVRTL